MNRLTITFPSSLRRRVIWACPIPTCRCGERSISLILNSGNADLWNKIKFDTCTQYNINGVKQLKHITLTVNNCNTTAIIEKVSFKQN